MGQIWPYILASLVIIPMQVVVVYFLWRGLFQFVHSKWQRRPTPQPSAPSLPQWDLGLLSRWPWRLV